MSLYSQRFAVGLQTLVRAAASPGRGMLINGAKNQVPGGKGLPSAGLALYRAGDSARAHVASCHTRDFAVTHLKTRRYARPGSFGPRTAASRRLVPSVQPPARLFCAPPRPFRDFDNVFLI